jgi:hypothetical protein
MAYFSVTRIEKARYFLAVQNVARCDAMADMDQPPTNLDL